jgi:hypothetical protein
MWCGEEKFADVYNHESRVLVMSQIVANNKVAKIQTEVSTVYIHPECRARNAPAVQDQTRCIP